MKYILTLLLAFVNVAFASDCTVDIWTPENLSYCVAENWQWDEAHRLAFQHRLENKVVEVEILDVRNARCDVVLSIYDPYIIEKQQFFECFENMTPQD